MAAPTLTSVTPNFGTNNGRTTLTLTGSDFTGTTGVTIGGVAATNVTVVSDTSITLTCPAGSAGTASIVVTNGTGSNGANTLFFFIGSGVPTDTYIYLKGGRGDGFVPMWTGAYADLLVDEKSEPYRNIFQTTAQTQTSGISGVGGSGSVTMPGTLATLGNTYATGAVLTMTIGQASDEVAGTAPRQFDKVVTWRQYVSSNGLTYAFRLADILGIGSQSRSA